MSDGKVIEAKVWETGASRYSVEVGVAGHALRADEPIEDGGGDTGPSPHATLLAALGACTAITVRWYAEREKWPLDKVSVELTYHKEGRTDHFSKKIKLEGEGLTEAQRQKLIEVAAKCPVQRTLEGTPIISTLTTD